MIATYDSMLSLDYGRPVLSTVRLLDWRNPGPCPGGAYCDDPDNHLVKRFRWVLEEQPDGPPVLRSELLQTDEVHRKRHPFYVPWTTYRQFLEWRDGDVFADEITGFASSREIKNMPPQVANTLVQLRRRNIVLRWTTPSWGRADVIIREVSQAVTLCVGMMGQKRPQAPDEAPRVWRDNRLFVARTYDPTQFDEVEARRLANAETDVWAAYWGPQALVRSAYDTLDAVTALGWANEAGVCISCGGERRRAACRCPKDHSEEHSHGTDRVGAPARKRSGAGSPERGPVAPSAPVPVFASGKVAALLPRAQEAAGQAGTLDLADALSLSHAEWSARDGDAPPGGSDSP